MPHIALIDINAGYENIKINRIMMKNFSENKIFSGNVLKIIALIAMSFDHVGKVFFPNALWMQIIGRISFPLFSYMIAEGCLYTKNRKRYFSVLSLLALLFQIIYYIFVKSLYMCIFVTFSLSVLTIYSFDNLKKRKSTANAFIAILTFCVVVFLTKILPRFTAFKIDYGFFGVMLPVAVYFSEKKYLKLINFTAILILLSADIGGVQIYSLFSLPLISLYNGKRGKLNLKYLFYVYYPLHLAVIYLTEVIT